MRKWDLGEVTYRRRKKRRRRKGKSVWIMLGKTKCFESRCLRPVRWTQTKRNRPKATELIREWPREKKGWQTHTSLLSCLPWDRRRRRREEWRKEGRRRSRKTVGSLKTNTRLRNRPSPPPLPSLFWSLTQVQKNPLFMGFPKARRDAERQDRERQRDAKTLSEKEREHFS